MQASYPGLRRCRRGGLQSVFIFLLNTVLVNLYLLSLYSDHFGNKALYSNQLKFREALIQAIFAKYGGVQGTRKRSISSTISKDSPVPAYKHIYKCHNRNGDCRACFGETIYTQGRRKRVALSETTGNSSRKMDRTSTQWGYREYRVPICKRRVALINIT